MHTGIICIKVSLKFCHALTLCLPGAHAKSWPWGGADVVMGKYQMEIHPQKTYPKIYTTKNIPKYQMDIHPKNIWYI